MKPSERIMEIRDQNGVSVMNTINPGFDMFVALCQYLDEEYAKNQAIINSDKTGQVGMV